MSSAPSTSHQGLASATIPSTAAACPLLPPPKYNAWNKPLITPGAGAIPKQPNPLVPAPITPVHQTPPPPPTPSTTNPPPTYIPSNNPSTPPTIPTPSPTNPPSLLHQFKSNLWNMHFEIWKEVATAHAAGADAVKYVQAINSYFNHYNLPCVPIPDDLVKLSTPPASKLTQTSPPRSFASTQAPSPHNSPLISQIPSSISTQSSQMSPLLLTPFANSNINQSPSKSPVTPQQSTPKVNRDTVNFDLHAFSQSTQGTEGTQSQNAQQFLSSQSQPSPLLRNTISKETSIPIEEEKGEEDELEEGELHDTIVINADNDTSFPTDSESETSRTLNDSNNYTIAHNVSHNSSHSSQGAGGDSASSPSGGQCEDGGGVAGETNVPPPAQPLTRVTRGRLRGMSSSTESLSSTVDANRSQKNIKSKV
ncbi:MAG: hypothetical protein AAGM46_26455 [Cyanobacteria bacterium J06582_2]